MQWTMVLPSRAPGAIRPYKICARPTKIIAPGKKYLMLSSNYRLFVYDSVTHKQVQSARWSLEVLEVESLI